MGVSILSINDFENTSHSYSQHLYGRIKLLWDGSTLADRSSPHRQYQVIKKLSRTDLRKLNRKFPFGSRYELNDECPRFNSKESLIDHAKEQVEDIDSISVLLCKKGFSSNHYRVIAHSIGYPTCYVDTIQEAVEIFERIKDRVTV